MRAYPCPTGSRSRATTAAPRGARHPPRTRTFARPTGTRSCVPTVAPRVDRPSPRTRTYTGPTGTRSRAPTAAPRGVHTPPHPSTCLSPTGSRSSATPATSRDVHPSPLPHKGVLDATGDLTVAGAAPHSNIRAPRHQFHKAPQTAAPSPSPRRASRGSPLGAVRDRRGRRNTQI
jgi:hypothetical protein